MSFYSNLSKLRLQHFDLIQYQIKKFELTYSNSLIAYLIFQVKKTSSMCPSFQKNGNHNETNR